MDNYIMKYLLIKMSIDYGYSATEEEIKASMKYLEKLNVVVDENYNERYVTKKDNTYYALYSIDKTVIKISDIENFDIISTYIRDYSKKDIFSFENVSEESFKRAKNLTIYLIIVLNFLDKNLIHDKKDLLEDIDEEEKLSEKYIKLFDKLSLLLAHLLEKSKNENIDDIEELKIINVNPIEIISSYKAYYYYKVLEKEFNNIFSTILKDEYSIVMSFGTNSYYGLPSIKQDLFFACNAYDMYGPIYMCVSKSFAFKDAKRRDEKRVNELIKRLIKK